jgi:hypothetical protein
VSAIRWYLDEDSVAESLVRALRARGMDVRTALDDRMIGRSDEEQLHWAAANGRVLVSFNVGDFYRLHTAGLSKGEQHAGIVLVQQRRRGVGSYLQGFLRLAAARSAEEMLNQVVFLTAWMRDETP